MCVTSGWKSRHMTPQGAWHRNSGYEGFFRENTHTTPASVCS